MVAGLLEAERSAIASRLRVKSSEIVFTSGGTESNNTVIASSYRQSANTIRRRLVIGATEHPSIIEPARRWESDGGYVSRVPVDRHGIVRLDALKEILAKNDTTLVSIMWANNETGTINPMVEIADLVHRHGVLLHSDAVQAMGKVDINLHSVPLDYASFSAHKFHGPHGLGMLFVSERAPFHPLILGGGQENGRRSGTENVPSVSAMAFAHVQASVHSHPARDLIAKMRDTFEHRVIASTSALLNGHPTLRLDNTSSLAFPGLDAAALLIMLDEQGICCSAGSACHSATLHPSHVLEAMGFDAEHAKSTLRFSFSRFNTMDEANAAADMVIEVVGRLRDMTSGGPVILA
jgi:cysteine desulfurase